MLYPPSRIRITALLALVVSMLQTATGRAEESARIKSIRVNVGMLKPGQMMVVRCGLFPVWVLRRTETDIRNLKTASPDKLVSPRGEKWESSFIHAYDMKPILPKLLYLDQVALEAKPLRSIRPDILVVLGVAPETGCAPTYYAAGSSSAPAKDWTGGFLDPCSKQLYDLAGRVLKSDTAGAGWNMYIPPHQFIDKDTLLIGLGEPPRALPSRDFKPVINYDALDRPHRLHQAAKRGRLDIVKVLVVDGMPVDTPIEHDISPLLIAATMGQYAVAEFLLEHGADPNRGNAGGFAPIHGAIAGGHVGIIDLLANKGADVNQICPTLDCKGTSLNFAIHWLNGQPVLEQVIVRLINHGADPRIRFKGENAYD